MPVHMTVNLDLTEAVTMSDVRAFLEKAEALDMPDDVDLRDHDDNGDLTGLEAVGDFGGSEPRGA